MLEYNRDKCGRWKIGNSIMPIEGPETINTVLDFTQPGEDTVKLDQNNICPEREKFSGVQTIYVDLSSTDNDLTIRVDKSGQVLIIKGRRQGYYPVVVPNNWSITFKCTDVAARIPVQLLNYQVPPGEWATK